MSGPGYALQDLVYRLTNLCVGDAHNAKPERLQGSRPFGITLARCLMDLTIYLYDELGLCAVEVRDEAVDGVLPSKLEVGELPVAQSLPEQILLDRRLSSHLATYRLQLVPDMRPRVPPLTRDLFGINHKFPSFFSPLRRRRGEKKDGNL